MSYDVQVGNLPQLGIERTPAIREVMAIVKVPHMAAEPAGYYIQTLNFWYFGAAITLLPAGQYVQMQPLMRHVQVKKGDGEWAQILSIAGENRVGLDGVFVLVDEY